MNLLETCRKAAHDNPGRVVFPDGMDVRAVKAAIHLRENGLASPMLLGNPFAIRAIAMRHALMLRGVPMIDPEQARLPDEFVAHLKTRMPDESEDALIKKLRDPLWFGASMVAARRVDYCVAGNLASTASVLRAGLKVLGLESGLKTVSSIMFMIPPGDGKVLGFSDCGVLPQPTAAQLADIAISSAENFERVTGEVARVAMLSFSTRGSAKHANVASVAQATAMVRKRAPKLLVDGELQFDAAMVPSVAAQKAPGSLIAGEANVLIFPSLEAGNIGYKIAQRLGHYTAIGPMIQGLNGAMHDLSRGCTWEDMVDITLLAARMRLRGALEAAA